MAEKEYIGSIRKCPNCGTALESLQSRCSNCGHELTNVEVNQTIAQFADDINAIEDKRPYVRVAIGTRKEFSLSSFITAIITAMVILALGISMVFVSKILPLPIPDVLKTILDFILRIPGVLRMIVGIPLLVIGFIKFLSSFSKKTTKICFNNTAWNQNDDDKKQFVENFPIPNAREDFLEFFILAIGHIYPKPRTKYEETWNGIWAAKCKQVYTKARIAMASEPELVAYMKQLAQESGFSL
ncbi:MAG: zinc ribbon domain-containing protein [Spirochaetales bacterium]|jgi:hypothetical protein|nr:zinc ribbon domain-containing protein [Spirochaetales bacterium]